MRTQPQEHRPARMAGIVRAAIVFAAAFGLAFYVATVAQTAV